MKDRVISWHEFKGACAYKKPIPKIAALRCSKLKGPPQEKGSMERRCAPQNCPIWKPLPTVLELIERSI